MQIDIDKKQETILSFLLIIFSFLLIGSDALEGLKLYDEGVTVYGALETMHGKIPYRDFWTVYMPGHFYLYALVFKVFGVSLVVERYTSVVIMVAASYTFFLLAKRFLNIKLALLTFLATSIWFSTFDFFGYILYPALLFGFASILYFVKGIQEEKYRYFLISGLFVGMVALFRHDFGAYIFVAMVAIQIAESIFVQRHTDGGKIFQYLLPATGRLVLGTAISFLPVAIFFLIKVPFVELYDSLIGFPLHLYSDYRKLPFPDFYISFGEFKSTNDGGFADYVKDLMDRLYLYFPLIVFSAFLLQIIIQWKQKLIRPRTNEFWMKIFLFLVGVLFYTKIIVRSVYLHVMPAFIIAILIYFIVLVQIPKTLKNKWVNLVATWALLLLVLPAFFRPFYSEVMGYLFDKSKKVPLTEERAKGIEYDIRGREYEKVITYVDSLTAPDEKIFVGTSRHDRIFTNDVMFYFLSERESATKYSELHPGVATTMPVQQHIVNDIEKAGVNVIVLTGETRVETENLSGVSSNVRLLDDYIAAHYQSDTTFGNYEVLRKIEP